MHPTTTTPSAAASRPHHGWRRWGICVLLLALATGSCSIMQQAAPPAAIPIVTTPTSATFVLRSPAVAEGGDLPKEYTGDGASATLPLTWQGAPRGTQSYALIMHHLAPDQLKWYWILYNIPADVTSLPMNVAGIGTLGNNSVNRQLGYAPPHSKGPGPKTYVYTLYALSAPPALPMPAADVDRAALLAAMAGHMLASAELHVVYTRSPPPGAPLAVPPGAPRTPPASMATPPP